MDVEFFAGVRMCLDFPVTVRFILSFRRIEMLQIGDLSKLVDISTKTIRYYEEIELLPPPRRAENGYRQYDQSDVERLRFIRRARSLDFALDDIMEILAFRERGEAPCQYVMFLMEERIGQIAERIKNLKSLKTDLKQLHKKGLQLPEDVEMKQCVCHLIEVGPDAG
jgi:DNA-binding transcriptional MerR regulator